MIYFGMAPIKTEGAPVQYDSEPVGPIEESSWMEFRVVKSATRAEVHALVEEWLDENNFPIDKKEPNETL